MTLATEEVRSRHRGGARQFSQPRQQEYGDEYVGMATRTLITEWLILGPRRIDDAPAALDVYGDAEVTRWLSPDMDRVPDLAAMWLLQQ